MASRHLVMQQLDHVLGDLVPVVNYLAHVARIEDLPQDVAIALGVIAEPAEEPRERAVRHEHVPIDIRDERRVRLLMLENVFHRLAHQRQLRRLEVGLGVARRIARGHEQCVALAKRHIQRVSQSEHQLDARLRLPGLDPVDVSPGDIGAQGQIELAYSACGAPLAQELADVRGRDRRAW